MPAAPISPPAVSILMSVRDGTYLMPAVESLLAQRFAGFELVLVDDASDPETRAKVEHLRASDRRIRVFRNPRNLGLPASLNRGLAHCRAPLVARADADDVYHPERLERQIAVFRRRPSLGALSCGYRRITQDGRPLYVHRPIAGPARLRFRTLFTTPLLHPGVMFRAEAVRALGGYDERYWTAQDSDLWARLAARAELDNLPEPLVEWRLHGTSILSSRGEAGRALSLSIRRRQQAAYLGQPLALEDVRAGVDLLRDRNPQPTASVQRGERMLRRILAEARRREAPEVLEDFRRSSAWALLRQARHRAARRPSLAASLALRAAFWRCGAPSQADARRWFAGQEVRAHERA